MLRDLFAIVVLLLAISPFTAPFQTCDAGYAVAVAAVTHDDDDPGDAMTPLVPKTFDMLIAPPGLITNPHQGSSATFLPRRAVANHVQHPRLRLAILRV